MIFCIFQEKKNSTSAVMRKMRQMTELRILMFLPQGSHLFSRRKIQILGSQARKNTRSDNEGRTISAESVTNILKLPLTLKYTCACTLVRNPLNAKCVESVSRSQVILQNICVSIVGRNLIIAKYVINVLLDQIILPDTCASILGRNPTNAMSVTSNSHSLAVCKRTCLSIVE